MPKTIVKEEIEEDSLEGSLLRGLEDIRHGRVTLWKRFSPPHSCKKECDE